jgi:Bacterial Ig-like domain/Laminin B (Domain IV)/FG-GAP repeat/RTX calcium-binding nonapeptide repeat (4 copies)
MTFLSFSKPWRKNRERMLRSENLAHQTSRISRLRLLALEPLESRLTPAGPFQLSSLLAANGGNGTAGFAINGVAAGDQSGRSVAIVGDVNGDGLDDLLIDALLADPDGRTSAGEAYLVFGTVEGTQASLNLSSLNGTNGFVLAGAAADDLFGREFSAAGDVNGDGFADLFIGASSADPNGSASGQSYLVFGGLANLNALDTAGATAADGRINVASVDGVHGFAFNGIAAGNFSGTVNSGAGDVNGDGFDDLLIGAPFASAEVSESGQFYLIFGGLANLSELDSAGNSASDGKIQLSALDGIHGFVFDGISIQDHAGFAVSCDGDVNGDGFADLMLGVDGSDVNGYNSGQIYLIFGGLANLMGLDRAAGGAGDGLIELSAVNGAFGYKINGIAARDNAGHAAAIVGDVNGDGFADLAIGAAYADAGGSNTGQTYLLFGGIQNLTELDSAGGTALDGQIELTAIDGTHSFAFNGIFSEDRSGYSVQAAGDVNGDGFADLLIGAKYADPNGSASGQSYVVFGGQPNLIALDTAGGSTADGRIDLAALDGVRGFKINGINNSDLSGRGVGNGGDVNGDGFADVMIGAWGADPNGPESGQSYVVFGGNFTNSATQVGTANADTLTGSAVVDVLVGGRGDDALVGNGGADVLYGGSGDDVLAVSNTTFARIDGGNGSDTLRLVGGGLKLDLTALADHRLLGIEVIDITGSGANTLTLNVREVLNLTQPSNPAATSNTLTVFRDRDDMVNFGTGWAAQANEVAGNLTFNVFTQGAAILKIELSRTPNEVVTSTFDASVDGWTIIGDAQHGTHIPAYHATGGNPGGYISATDDRQGTRFLFSAPPKFLGDQSDSYGYFLEYDMFQSSTNNQLNGQRDIVLSNGNTSLYFNTPNPGIFPTHYQVHLLAAAGWVNLESGQSATEAEMQSVLSSLSLLVILGEHRNGAETCNIDNFVLGSDGDTNTIDVIRPLTNTTAPISVESRFDTNADGWILIGDAQPDTFLPEYRTSGGNPGGHIVASDQPAGFTVQFLAPPKFLGDHASAYGQFLTYDFKDNLPGPVLSPANDVTLSNGSLTLILDTANPNKFWTAGRYLLHESAGWKNIVTGEVATATEIKSVLSSLSMLLIRGEYIDGGERAFLDNVVFGGVSNPFQLSSLLAANGGNGTAGFAINGVAAGDQSGRSVAIVGDVNGDGLDDLLIDALLADPDGRTSAGEAYLVFGTVEGTQASLNLSSLNGTNGFVLAGAAADDLFGREFSAAGDVNGDGFADLFIGASSADPNGSASGQSYLVFGGLANLNALDTAGATAADGRINVASVDGVHGFAFNGIAAGNFSGTVNSGAGDVNGDGFDDLLIGAPFASAEVSESGQFYLIFGGLANLSELDSAGNSASDGKIQLSALDGIHGFVFDGISIQDHAGFAVSCDGDVNGDGFADLMLGVDGSDVNGYNSGQIYLIFGGLANLMGLDRAAGGAGDGLIELSAVNGAFGYKINGIAARDNAGHAAAIVGDVNGDGFADLAIGAAYADAGGSNTGQTYLLFGGIQNLTELDSAGGTALDGQIELTAIDGTHSFAFNGIFSEDRSGYSVQAAGDVNGDGFADLLIGAKYADPNGSASGQSYVVFGGQPNLIALDTAGGSTADGRIDLAALDGVRGFKINGINNSDLSGRGVGNGGDVNGDGFADVMIGAWGADPNGPESGQSYVVFGGNFTNSATQVGTANADTLTGSAVVDVLVGGRGDDALVGNGGADVLYGGSGDDVLAVSNTTFARIDGGNGSDTLRLVGGGLKLDLTALADHRLLGIEVIDITGSGANTLTLNVREVLNLSNESNTLIVRRNSGDVVNIGSGWTQVNNQTIGADVLNVYTRGAATLKVISTDITAPTVGSLSPADNGIAVPINSNLVITFNEPIQNGSGNIVIKKSSDNSVVQTIDVSSDAVTIMGATATVDPTDLSVATGYYIEVLAGAFKDLAFNDFAGISGADTWNFATTSAIVNEKIYYNRSFFAAGGNNVPAALDTAKVIAKSSSTTQTLSYTNLINTTRGINGIVLDIAGLASTSLTAADFDFRMSPTGLFNEAANPPSTWTGAPAPTGIFMTPGTATSPARVRLEWNDNAIANRWLQIRVFANANTGLAVTEVHYLGHLQGEVNGAVTGGAFFVTTQDQSAVLPLGAATITTIRDLDKNGFVTTHDLTAVRSSITAGRALRVITIPAAGSTNEGTNELNVGQPQNGEAIAIVLENAYLAASPAVPPTNASISERAFGWLGSANSQIDAKAIMNAAFKRANSSQLTTKMTSQAAVAGTSPRLANSLKVNREAPLETYSKPIGVKENVDKVFAELASGDFGYFADKV